MKSNWLSVKLITELLEPLKTLSNIGLFLCKRSNSFLISLSVPKYSPSEEIIEVFPISIVSVSINGFVSDCEIVKTLTSRDVFSIGVTYRETFDPTIVDPKEHKLSPLCSMPYSAI